jgi:hypothetical protein
VPANIDLPQNATTPEETATERRATPRYPILRRCLVWPQDDPVDAEGWRCIAYDISLNGIGLTLPLPPRPGTVLTVEAWGLPATRRLRVRVVHARPVAFVWICGCALDNPLDEAELRAWLQGPRA